MTSDPFTSLSKNFTALFILLKINIIDERFYIAKRERGINEKKKKRRGGLDVDKVESTEDLRQAGDDGAIAS